MRRFLIGLTALIAILGGGIWYSQRPAFGPEEFPPQGILHFSDAGPPSPVAPSEITVVSYNIGYASGKKNNKGNILKQEEVQKNLAELAETLRQLKPDLIALQEVDFRSRRTFDTDQFRFLAKALGMPYGAYVVTWNKNYLPWPYWPPNLHYGRLLSGQAVLSRFPILSQEARKSEKPAGNPFWYNWFYLDRILQRLTLKIGDQEASLWNVHLDAFDFQARLRQAELLGGWVRSDPNPLKWAAGDYNSVSVYGPELTSEQRKELEDAGEPLEVFSRLSGLKMDPPDPGHLTAPSWEPIRKIDHIFYSPNQSLTSSGTVPGALASDHLPVWARFTGPFSPPASNPSVRP